MIRFKNLIPVLAMGSLFSPSALYADVARENVPQQVATTALPGEDNAAKVLLTVGPGLAVLNGNAGWAANVGVLVEIGFNGNLLVGADFGVNGWDFKAGPGNNANLSATAVQLTPTAIYRFEIPGPLFPYVGVSVGPNIYVDRVRVTDLSGTRVDTFTNTYFEILARPGFFARLSEVASLQVEAKFGALRGDFAFLPQVNLALAL